jgi:hypothetical protein
MLRSAQRLVVPQAGLLQQACFSTEVAYNELVFKGTSDLAKVDKVPDKEIGMCAGVPLETYKRKVRHLASGSSSGTASSSAAVQNKYGLGTAALPHVPWKQQTGSVLRSSSPFTQLSNSFLDLVMCCSSYYNPCM